MNGAKEQKQTTETKANEEKTEIHENNGEMVLSN